MTMNQGQNRVDKFLHFKRSVAFLPVHHLPYTAIFQELIMHSIYNNSTSFTVTLKNLLNEPFSKCSRANGPGRTKPDLTGFSTTLVTQFLWAILALTNQSSTQHITALNCTRTQKKCRKEKKSNERAKLEKIKMDCIGLKLKNIGPTFFTCI